MAVFLLVLLSLGSPWGKVGVVLGGPDTPSGMRSWIWLLPLPSETHRDSCALWTDQDILTKGPSTQSGEVGVDKKRSKVEKPKSPLMGIREYFEREGFLNGARIRYSVQVGTQRIC